VRRIIVLLILVWLVVGIVAAGQRHDFTAAQSCSRAGTIAATVAVGPLNYMGVDPKASCTTPQPSH